ncbi:Protein O-mannosyltransferase 2 [Coemansia sp. RSA 1933]|nr:Protein O-mannosyltransferase 2 [Coemansia sp. RSA 1933]
MSMYARKAGVFYDERAENRQQGFDRMHLAHQPGGGFSAYPLDKSTDGLGASLAMARQKSRGISERMILVVVTLLACLTKLYRIGRRSSVSWDEAHFGKFGAYYLNRTFYHDVHPPLAKMLVGLSELLAGHNGTFGFKGGETYPPFVNYTFMRMFNAAFGVALTPMAYVTCRRLRLPPQFAVLAALCVTMDNAICVMSRFILLDAPLLGFTALALTMVACFYRQRTRPFSSAWWRYLFLTGLALGLVSSTKWVGFFAVALVGLYTIVELSEMFCNVRLPAHVYAKHWAARIAALIVVPLMVYMACFKVHFAVLDRYDGSANFMPMGFQVRLRGNPVARQPYEVHTGAQVRLHSPRAGTGYLHSHSHKYPSGSQRQQITGYGFADQNNLWLIQRRMAASTFTNAADLSADVAPIAGPVGNGDLVTLRHNGTDTFLYTDSIHAAPYSKGNSEVSAIAADASYATSAGALWIVEIVGPERRMDDGLVHPLGTPFRLRSAANGCILRASGERLDKGWGWGQAEITCDTKARDGGGAEHTWVVERNINKALEAVNLGGRMGSSFVRDFAVLNRQMWLTNNALVPDHDKHNVLESDPASWPLMMYPMRMVGWDDHSIKYLEVGNPFLWWASAVLCVVVFPAQLLYWLVCWQRQCVTSWHKGEFRDYIDGAMFLWGGWALHYLPFFLMGRVTYLHHYLPALYFGILFTVYQIYHTAVWYLTPRRVLLVLYVVATLVVFGFWWFSPLTYGWDKPIDQLWGMQWASTWPVYSDKYSI